ncbi:MAG: hypothetical protein V4649_06255 [Bacteroidota bacterium]
MAQRKIMFYDILVYIAYGYFFLLGLGWFVTSFMSTGFNYQAFLIVAVFAAQAYFRHRLTDLIIGLLILGLSIFMLLQSIEIIKAGKLEDLGKVMLGMSVISIVMSLILMFSYVKLSFRDKEEG